MNTFVLFINSLSYLLTDFSLLFRPVSFTSPGTASLCWAMRLWCTKGSRFRESFTAERMRRTARTASSSAASRRAWRPSIPARLDTAEKTDDERDHLTNIFQTSCENHRCTKLFVSPLNSNIKLYSQRRCSWMLIILSISWRHDLSRF